MFKTDKKKIACSNVLHTIEILTNHFSNAKVDKFFGRMNRTKTDTRNQLSQERLGNQLRLGEDVNNELFNRDPYIQKWSELGLRRFKGVKHRDNYPKKKMSAAGVSSSQVTIIAPYAFSDLGDEESDND